MEQKKKRKKDKVKKAKKAKKEKLSKKLKKKDVNSNLEINNEDPTSGVGKTKRKRSQSESSDPKVKKPKLKAKKETLSTLGPSVHQIPSLLTHRHLKMEALEQTLSLHLPKGRGVICTSSSQVAQTLTTNLLATGYSACCVRNPSLTLLSQQILRSFHDSQKKILVTTDSLLEQLEINSAHWLLYFDPPKSFLQTFPKWTPVTVISLFEQKNKSNDSSE